MKNSSRNISARHRSNAKHDRRRPPLTHPYRPKGLGKFRTEANNPGLASVFGRFLNYFSPKPVLAKALKQCGAFTKPFFYDQAMFTLVVRVRKVYHLDRRKFRVDSGFQPNILEILLMDI